MNQANQTMAVLVAVSNVNLGTTLGASLLGVFFCAILYGVTVVQVYTFFHLSDDRWVVKVSVFIMWMLTTLHLAFFIETLYTTIVTNYLTTPADVNTISWSELGITVIEALLSILVRCLFCSRIWNLSSRNVYLITAILIPMVADSVFILIVAVKEIHWRSFASLAGPDMWIAYAGDITGLVADIVLGSSQILLLWRRRSQFHRTNSVLRLFIVYSINTCVLVTACAVITLVTFAIMPGNEIYQAAYVQLGPLLLNSLLASYNLRWSVRQEISGNPLQYPMISTDSTPVLDFGRKGTGNSSEGEQSLTVRIETSTETTTDTGIDCRC
ncbi:hypothetical protein CERSUDRAFT_95624 [Gelatoporia subvermispora B]|uniref:DUF6534 domain-containing protein n=1 Tax=Ceriporiopsis subvermispora (strain B) TaxID=914234 RepID=M2PJ98_CERS8|nr:hypothetical protein CERSUDRAFT_95624 [Gelatoporia subvermispora B]